MGNEDSRDKIPWTIQQDPDSYEPQGPDQDQAYQEKSPKHVVADAYFRDRAVQAMSMHDLDARGLAWPAATLTGRLHQ